MDLTLPLSATETARETADGDGVAVQTSLGAVRVVRYADVAELRTAWRALETQAQCSHAQSYSWVSAWLRHIPGEFVIVAGHDSEGRVVFIWPFEIERKRGVRVLSWLGRAHANYNMGLFEPAFAERITGDDLMWLLVAAAKSARADIAALRGQPVEWEGKPNPFLKLPHRPSASAGYAAKLNRDFDAYFGEQFSSRSRNQLKRKEKWLADQEPLVIAWAKSVARQRDLLEIFFVQKTQRFAEQGIRDAFADIGHRDFFRELATLPEEDGARLHIGSLELGDAVIATSASAIHKGRCYLLFSSLAEGAVRKGSPGSILFWRQIEDLSQRGVEYYDMGAGAARHKDEWCNRTEERFDSFIGLTGRGRALARAYAISTAIKKRIKDDPRLWKLARETRKRLFGAKSTPPPGE